LFNYLCVRVRVHGGLIVRHIPHCRDGSQEV